MVFIRNSPVACKKKTEFKFRIHEDAGHMHLERKYSTPSLTLIKKNVRVVLKMENISLLNFDNELFRFVFQCELLKTVAKLIMSKKQDEHQETL